MGSQIVNQENLKNREFIEGAASADEKIITTAMAIQNNTPHKLQIIETNNKGVKNLPFMIDDNQIVNDSKVEVTVRLEDTEKEKANKDTAPKRKNEDIIH